MRRKSFRKGALALAGVILCLTVFTELPGKAKYVQTITVGGGNSKLSAVTINGIKDQVFTEGSTVISGVEENLKPAYSEGRTGTLSDGNIPTLDKNKGNDRWSNFRAYNALKNTPGLQPSDVYDGADHPVLTVSLNKSRFYLETVSVYYYHDNNNSVVPSQTIFKVPDGSGGYTALDYTGGVKQIDKYNNSYLVSKYTYSFKNPQWVNQFLVELVPRQDKCVAIVEIQVAGKYEVLPGNG